MEEIEIRNEMARKALNLSLFSNFILAILKSIFGVISHSSALLADGINSTSDVIYLIFVKIYMKFADKPADKEHPYGHAQFESVASIIVGAFVLTTAVAIFWDSLNKVYYYVVNRTIVAEPSVWALVVAISTIIIKILLSAYTKKIATKYNSSTVLAVAKDHKNDILSAAAATIGIIFSLFGHEWVDPVAGAFVAVFILKTGIQIIRDSSDELMKTTPESRVYMEIEKYVMQIKGVNGIQEIYVQYFGIYMMINITIYVDGEISVKNGDVVADGVEEILYKNMEYVKKYSMEVVDKQMRKIYADLLGGEN